MQGRRDPSDPRASKNIKKSYANRFCATAVTENGGSANFDIFQHVFAKSQKQLLDMSSSQQESTNNNVTLSGWTGKQILKLKILKWSNSCNLSWTILNTKAAFFFASLSTNSKIFNIIIRRCHRCLL